MVLLWPWILEKEWTFHHVHTFLFERKGPHSVHLSHLNAGFPIRAAVNRTQRSVRNT